MECSVLEMSKESFGEAKPSLLSAIVSVHHHYNTKKEYFDWFLKLVSYVPQSILNSLEKQAKIEVSLQLFMFIYVVIYSDAKIMHG